VTPLQFIEQLCNLKFDCAFNPYAQRCVKYDRENAPQIRARQLLSVLRRARGTTIDSLWIGRDLGYRGGRRTGLAFTDDRHLMAHAERWHLQLQRPTRGEQIGENSATVIWRALSQIDQPIFLWNVFPLHPFHPDSPFSNRTHNALERKIGTEVLIELIALLQPRRLLSIGRHAARVTASVRGHLEVIELRHPSYGGQREFLQQAAAYRRMTHG